MLLSDKTAVIHGAGGHIGSAVARAFARDGAKLFLAGTLRDGYDDNGEPRKEQKEQIALIQEVLKNAPNDSAANHYWIHAVEASPHPEQALKSAALLASLAPASGHMVHMPGHIYYRAGNYAEAEH